MCAGVGKENAKRFMVALQGQCQWGSMQVGGKARMISHHPKPTVTSTATQAALCTGSIYSQGESPLPISLQDAPAGRPGLWESRLFRLGQGQRHPSPIRRSNLDVQLMGKAAKSVRAPNHIDC